MTQQINLMHRDEYLARDQHANKASQLCKHPFNWHVVYAVGNEGVSGSDAGKAMVTGWGVEGA